MSVVKAAATVGGTGSMAAAFAAGGWPAVAGVITLAVLFVGETVWVLNNLDQCDRLVMVIAAVRGERTSPPAGPPLAARAAQAVDQGSAVLASRP